MSTDRVVLVTGGSLGVGQATVAAFAGRGYRVVAMARDAERLAASVAQLEQPLRARVSAIAGDVRSEADIAAVLKGTMARHGRLDVLVNSAGVSMRANRRLIDSDVDEWRRIIDINLTGTYLMCRAALPYLEASPDASIVNVQSTAAHAANAGVGVYAASKFGVRALTESLVEEYRGSTVRVTSVSPGPIDTNIWSHKLEPPDEARRSRMMRATDIADIILWLVERPTSLHIPNITVTPWTPS
jgi:3-oxoacyl-[acyl-carrier protein] reductase